MQRKTMATSIIRPAIIIGDSVTGEADSNFTLYGFMKALKVFKRRVEKRKIMQYIDYLEMPVIRRISYQLIMLYKYSQ